MLACASSRAGASWLAYLCAPRDVQEAILARPRGPHTSSTRACCPRPRGYLALSSGRTRRKSKDRCGPGASGAGASWCPIRTHDATCGNPSEPARKARTRAVHAPVGRCARPRRCLAGGPDAKVRCGSHVLRREPEQVGWPICAPRGTCRKPSDPAREIHTRAAYAPVALGRGAAWRADRKQK